MDRIRWCLSVYMIHKNVYNWFLGIYFKCLHFKFLFLSKRRNERKTKIFLVRSIAPHPSISLLWRENGSNYLLICLEVNYRAVKANTLKNSSLWRLFLINLGLERVPLFEILVLQGLEFGWWNKNVTLSNNLCCNISLSSCDIV